MELKRHNKLRITRAWYLIAIFNNYTNRILNESVLNSKRDYASLQKSADLINLFNDGDPVTVSDLNFDPSQLANECIKSKDMEERFLSMAEIFGFNHENVEVFLKRCEHEPGLQILKAYSSVFAKIMGYFVEYVSGDITRETLHFNIYTLNKYHPYCMKRFYTLLTRMENVMIDVQSVRQLRKNKRVSISPRPKPKSVIIC